MGWTVSRLLSHSSANVSHSCGAWPGASAAGSLGDCCGQRASWRPEIAAAWAERTLADFPGSIWL
jgi:hypothetical protein